jgi:CRP-like cAMP-binding protein
VEKAITIDKLPFDIGVKPSKLLLVPSVVFTTREYRKESSMSGPPRPANRLLAALTKKTYSSLSPNLEPYELRYKEIIFGAGDVIKDVYFPERGIISLLSSVGEHSTLEVGIVGTEGMAGLPLFLGEKRSNNLALVQGNGSALKMKAADLLAECGRSDELPKILRRFAHSLMTQISQSAVCNRYHPVDERLARWLLMTGDRMRSKEFLITQEFLSNMLGVRREAVNKSAGELQQRGLISYHRGDLIIHNRKKLESTACACYSVISRSIPS